MRLFLLQFFIFAVAVTLFADRAAIAAGDTPIAFSARVLGNEDRSRLIVDFDQKVKPEIFLLDNPRRVVVDLPTTLFSLPKSVGVPPDSAVGAMRFGSLTASRSRMILDLTRPAKPETSVLRDLSGNERHRLIIDLVTTDADTFAGLAREVDRNAVALPIEEDKRRFRVMLDPGHGGIDGGASAGRNTAEKDIVLAFAQKLRDRLTEDGAIDVLLTRDDDSFVPLTKRLAMVRDSHADLFLSIHADSLNQRGIRGATVYTLSERGSDALSRQLAQTQNRADLAAGLDLPDLPPEATDILVDFARRETVSFSQAFAEELVGAMGAVTRLINNPHRSADFFVLKSPEVPSVLLELGYLSNRGDAAQLRNPEWQKEATDEVAVAILRFLRPEQKAEDQGEAPSQ
jgi:N-acetylmuramoyl-L-alanine amidase